ncbi:MAG: hypothetical protein CME70_19565 [Halobacteriovorax sp.]|nr:hypothetical protein [Halobacteriovorax sp.]|tara:strand:+ start:792 stop:1901 length:1110 start_codon:yes stop_codon:yes gene_type:complete
MESVVQDLCEGLVKENVDVEVLCSHTKAVGSSSVINGVKVSKLFRLGTLFSQSINPSLIFRLFFKSKDYDLIHLHYPNPLAEFASLFLPKEKPLVITYHSDIIRQKSLLRFYKPLQRRILERAQKILVPTKNHIDCSPVLLEFKDKCEIIPFGINIKDAITPLEEKVNALKKEHGRFALFVGRLVGYKGLNILIEASKDIDQKILIVGQGPENERLREQVKKLGLSNKVKLLGRVEDLNEFWAYYEACEFFVLPSITSNENFGIVQLEAMYRSKAVITTDLKSGVPLVGEKGKTSLVVKPNDSEQLAKAIQFLFNNPEKTVEMGKAGRERFDKLYTLDKMISSHINSYRELLGQDLREAKDLDRFSKVS